MLHAVEIGAALYERDGDSYIPTVYCQGPWDPNSQFGGSPAALVATLVERMPSLAPMQLARLTTDLLRPIPMSPLTADVRVVREGKRIQVVAASLMAGGVEVARSTALRLRRTDLEVDGLPDGRYPNPAPTSPRPTDEDMYPAPHAHGSRRAMEYLFEEFGGHYSDPSWVRLRVDVIAGDAPAPVASVAYLADTASGIGTRRRELPVTWVNADVAVNIVREPSAEWLSLDGRGWVARSGSGQVQATVYDTEGVVATVSMVRLVDS